MSENGPSDNGRPGAAESETQHSVKDGSDQEISDRSALNNADPDNEVPKLPYPVRHLLDHHPVTAAIAKLIAEALGMRGLE